jgi:hypothetical protein
VLGGESHIRVAVGRDYAEVPLCLVMLYVECDAQ